MSKKNELRPLRTFLTKKFNFRNFVVRLFCLRQFNFNEKYCFTLYYIRYFRKICFGMETEWQKKSDWIQSTSIHQMTAISR